MAPPHDHTPFLIIGAQKSGTRWLRSNLGRHPEIFTADFEVSFFNYRRRYRDWGVSWYLAQFAGIQGERIVGEATPGYMMWRHKPHLVAERIHESVDYARLIAVLRDPVDRAHSALLHHMRRKRLPASSNILDVVRRVPPEDDRLQIIAGGWYARSLERYVELFGDQLLVVLHDDVKADPVGVYETALRHLGADPTFVPEGLGEVVFSNRGRVKKARETLTEEERVELFEYFRSDVDRLEEMIGRDLSAWRPEHAEQRHVDASAS